MAMKNPTPSYTPAAVALLTPAILDAGPEACTAFIHYTETANAMRAHKATKAQMQAAYKDYMRAMQAGVARHARLAAEEAAEAEWLAEQDEQDAWLPFVHESLLG